MIGFNRRHKKRHRRNPGSMTGRLKGMTAGFQPRTIKGVLPLAGGAFANFALREAISRRFPVVAKGLASYGVGLAGAGAMLLIPRVGAQMFAGAVTEEILRAVTEYALPNIKLLGEYLTEQGMSGLGELLSPDTPTVGMDAGFDWEDYVTAGAARNMVVG